MTKYHSVFVVIALFAVPILGSEQADDDEWMLTKAGFKLEPASLLPLVERHAGPALDAKTVRALIEQMGDESFAVRDRANRELVRIGRPAIAALREACEHKDVEIAKRASACVARWDAEEALIPRALRALARGPGPGTVRRILALDDDKTRVQFFREADRLVKAGEAPLLGEASMRQELLRG